MTALVSSVLLHGGGDPALGGIDYLLRVTAHLVAFGGLAGVLAWLRGRMVRAVTSGRQTRES